MNETTPTPKRQKTDPNDRDDNPSVPVNAGEITGIARRLRDLREKISEKEAALKALEDEEPETAKGTTDALDDKEKIKQLEREVLYQKELSALKDELSALETGFSQGEYYAATSEYWKKEIRTTPFNIDDSYNKSKWLAFVRTPDDVLSKPFECRHCKTTATALFVNDPYKSTREASAKKDLEIAKSDTTRTSASSQKDKALRDKVWPTDVFGNEARNQEISHLLPAGRQDHKEWIDVAAAVVGLGKDASIDDKKRATRGVKVPTANNRRSDMGVVHFVSNKLRLKDQKDIFDGGDPIGLLVPVMTVEEAKEWRGEGYTAIFLLGQPAEGVEPSSPDMRALYQDVGLNKAALMENDDTRDATSTEIESARHLLEDAVLALRAMIANLEDDYIVQLGLAHTDPILQAREQARNAECWLPVAVDSTSNRKPVCLLTLWGSTDYEKHPAPDPLLLALRAANIWGKMTNQRMLANGIKPDPYPDMSPGDRIAEMAYYEAKFGPFTQRPTTWEELAQGLGQPNGYCS